MNGKKVRCRQLRTCPVELTEENCRRCGAALPEPIVTIVERVVEKVVIRQDPQYILDSLEHAGRLISTAASERLTRQCVESAAPIVLAQASESGSFPTMAEMERAMILAAYRRSNRKPLEAARLAGNRKDDAIPQAARDRRCGSLVPLVIWSAWHPLNE